MDNIFDHGAHPSWQAGVIALAVIAVRLVLRKKASRRALCMLWALVAPAAAAAGELTLESPVSLQAEEARPSGYTTPSSRRETDKPTRRVAAPRLRNPPAAAVGRTGGTGTRAGGDACPFARWLPWIWVIGMGCMAAYML